MSSFQKVPSSLKFSEVKLETIYCFSYYLEQRKEFLQKQNIIFGKKTILMST